MISRSYNPRVISSNNMDLKALLLTQGVIVATCLSTFVAARQLAPEPSASSPSAPSSSSSLCSRALASTLWGAVFAFFSLMADEWRASKAVVSLSGHKSLTYKLAFFLLYGPVHPLIGIGMIFGHMFTTLRFRQILRTTNPKRGSDTMSNKLRRVIDYILVILFGINEPQDFLKSTRLVANTYIVLGMIDSTNLPTTHINSHRSAVKEDNMNDELTHGHKTVEDSCLMDQKYALTLGHKIDKNSCLKELNRAGKLALLESKILSNYQQLQFLEGRSRIATLIISVQTIGYVTSIVYRTIHRLPVSPIEIIGFAYSMFVIVCSVVYIVGVICQNPLVIYLDLAQSQEMLEKCKSTRWLDADRVNCKNAAIVGTMVVGSVVVAFTILVEWHVLRISWLDAIGPILFLFSFITQLFSNIIITKHLVGKTLEIQLLFGNAMISFGGIVVSIVATIVNWQTNKFDSRTPSMIHNLPFLG